MGLCASSAGAASSPPKATAMVLLPTGELREYPRHATAARALEDTAGSGEQRQEAGPWFLCDADTMGLEGPVSAVGGGEELRPGQIYFVLPAEARRRGLRREEVAALAVRASAALASASRASTAGRRRRGAVAPLVFSPPSEEEEEEVREVVEAGLDARKVKAAAESCAGMKRRTRRPCQRFASDLTAIPECESSE